MGGVSNGVAADGSKAIKLEGFAPVGCLPLGSALQSIGQVCYSE